MTRPDYPNCVMTPGVIRGVQERQRAYDKDPKAYEAEEKRHEEQKVMEREELTRINKEEDKERR